MSKRFLTLILRCRDEPFLSEFISHYLHEGVDFFYILDDNEHTTMPPGVLDNGCIEVRKSRRWTMEKNNIMADANILYDEIRHSSEWFIFVDADEFVTTRRHPDRTIREELETTFREVDCVKVPWVMMSCADREQDPDCLLEELVYRWDHDRRHPHPENWRKGRCRYEEIEVKSIFRGASVRTMRGHIPVPEAVEGFRVVDGVDGLPAPLDPFHRNLRNADIERALLACHHYRIMSRESALRKINSYQKLKAGGGYSDYSLETIMASDHAEVRDEVLRNKSIQRRQSVSPPPGRGSLLVG
jgi:hypothetical protein